MFNIPFNIHFLQAPAFSPLTSPFTVDEMEVLFKMIGEKITTHGDSENYPPREWIIIEKLNEHPVPILPEDVAEGLGSPYTSGRYLCHPAEDKNALAYMRIYKQIPYMGTEPDSSSVRGAQAVLPPPDFMELVALRDLTDMNCTATPRLLGWRHYTQDSDDLVPGGFVTYLVWEKVPGDPLGEEFWSLDYDQRERIRAKFKKAYSEVLNIGYQPILPESKYIILDKNTGDIKISGFRRAIPTDPGEKWDDYNFVMFSLVLPPVALDDDLPENIAGDIRTTGNNGWRW